MHLREKNWMERKTVGRIQQNLSLLNCIWFFKWLEASAGITLINYIKEELQGTMMISCDVTPRERLWWHHWSRERRRELGVKEKSLGCGSRGWVWIPAESCWANDLTSLGLTFLNRKHGSTFRMPHGAAVRSKWANIKLCAIIRIV